MQQGQPCLCTSMAGAGRRSPRETTCRPWTPQEIKWIPAMTSREEKWTPVAIKVKQTKGFRRQPLAHPSAAAEDISFHSCLPALAVHLAGQPEFIAPLIKSAERNTRLCLSHYSSQPKVSDWAADDRRFSAQLQARSHTSKEGKNRTKCLPSSLGETWTKTGTRKG